MHVLAFALTRNSAEADDMVQNVAVNALAAQDAVTLGTHLFGLGASYHGQPFHQPSPQSEEFSPVEEVPDSQYRPPTRTVGVP